MTFTVTVVVFFKCNILGIGDEITNPGQDCKAISENIDTPFICFVASPNGLNPKTDRTGPDMLSVMFSVRVKVFIF